MLRIRHGLLATLVCIGLAAALMPSVALADTPEAEESIKSTWKQLQKALKSGDAACEDYAPFLLHSGYRTAADDPTRNVDPDEPPTQEECESVTNFAAVLRTTKGRKFAEFDTGALVEGSAPGVTPGKKAVVVFLLDTDNEWKAIFASELPRQVGTKLKPRSAWNDSANGFVKSIQDGDCQQSFFYFTADSQFASRGAEGVCSGLQASIATGAGKSFDVSKSTGEPELLGGTRGIGFYGLELESGRYVTILLVKSTAATGDEHANPGVIDFVTTRAPDDEA